MSPHALSMLRRGLRKHYHLPLHLCLVPPSQTIWVDTLIDCSGFHLCSVPRKERKALGHISYAITLWAESAGDLVTTLQTAQKHLWRKETEFSSFAKPQGKSRSGLFPRLENTHITLEDRAASERTLVVCREAGPAGQEKRTPGWKRCLSQGHQVREQEATVPKAFRGKIQFMTLILV